MKHKNTRKNREQLAMDIVDCWDMDDLREYAIDRMQEHLNKETDVQFNETWADFYMEDAELED